MDSAHKDAWREDQIEVGAVTQNWDPASSRPESVISTINTSAAAGNNVGAASKKNIGIFSATAMGVSLMIGSGIFSTPASILGLVGTPSMALVLWGLGAVISFGGATAFIELGLMYRQNGGTMHFLAHAYPKPKLVLSYLFAWVMIVCIRPGAIAANGPVIGKYWLYAIGGLNVAHNDNWSRGFRGTSNDAHAYASALTKVFWAYDGFTNLVYSLGELRKPQRNLPWSIGGSVVIVGVLYIMANVAFFFVVPMDVAVNSEEILAAEFTYRVFGHQIGRVALPVLIGLSVLGAICAQTYGVSRLLDSANEVGFVPYGRQICGNHKKLGTPVTSLAIMYALTMLYLLAPPPGKVFDLLVDFVQWSTWLFYGLAAAGAIILRFTKPNHSLRSFKSFHPLNILFIIFCIYITIFPFVPPKSGSGDTPYPFYLSPLLGLITTLVGLVPWYLRLIWWPKRSGEDLTAWVEAEEYEEQIHGDIAAEPLGYLEQEKDGIRTE
ncbi:amino acid permease-domain-containing protein [Coemansia spiralis]|nr:amino acid permease-domain-containing protein [Coemansia spiralis]